MKIMISQPMKGIDPEQMKKDREAVVKELEKQGHEVLNTVFTEDAPKDIDSAIYYLSKSIDSIGKVDAVVFMPGWNTARGCRIEYQVAVEYGKFIKIL